MSRIIDYLETDRAIDAKRIALHGHSRIGKTALWASALDPRVAAVYASCPGEMGAALSRRDFGETVDDMAQRFPYWFNRNFQKWAGRWNDMPVDAHTLIALSAPRPVFITGGSDDQWADPVGEFQAEVAAGPVYRLLGKNGSRHDDAAAARHAADLRRSRLVLPHGSARGDARGLEGVPPVPGQVPSGERCGQDSRRHSRTRIRSSGDLVVSRGLLLRLLILLRETGSARSDVAANSVLSTDA